MIADLVRISGVSRDTIHRAERGIPINELNAHKLARALKTSVDDLEIPIGARG